MTEHLTDILSLTRISLLKLPVILELMKFVSQIPLPCMKIKRYLRNKKEIKSHAQKKEMLIIPCNKRPWIQNKRATILFLCMWVAIGDVLSKNECLYPFDIIRNKYRDGLDTIRIK